MELSSCQLWLQKVARIHRTFRSAGSYDVMDFIDEKDNPSLGFFHFVEHSLKSFLELSSELGSRNQSTHIKSEYGLILQTFRNISVENTLGQSFYYCGLTYARFTDEHRVVLGSSGKNLYGVSYLRVTAYYRVKLAFSCHLY